MERKMNAGSLVRVRQFLTFLGVNRWGIKIRLRLTPPANPCQIKIETGLKVYILSLIGR
jgi:hypothetical protein